MKVFVGGYSRCDWVYYQFAPLELVTEQEIDREYKTNVAALILTIQEAVKHFGAEGGSVINISSIVNRSRIAITVWMGGSIGCR